MFYKSKQYSSPATNSNKKKKFLIETSPSKVSSTTSVGHITNQMGSCCVSGNKKVENENETKSKAKSPKKEKSSSPKKNTHKSSNKHKNETEAHNLEFESNRESMMKAPKESIWNNLKVDAQLGDWLKNVPIFRRVPEDKRNRLGGMMTMHIYKNGQNVFKQGDEGDRFYIIREGKASVIVKLPDTGQLKNVATLSKGDYCMFLFFFF